MSEVTRADICAVAIAEAFRGDGERLCNPIGNLPLIGGRLAAATFEPHLALTDGFYTLLDPTGPEDVPPVGLSEEERLRHRTVGHWNPYREMFGLLWRGRRHVMMGATQIDRYGNQNIAAIGDWHRPKRQLLGFRGAPGNTINHTTSYWVPNHSPAPSSSPSTSCAASDRAADSVRSREVPRGPAWCRTSACSTRGDRRTACPPCASCPSTLASRSTGDRATVRPVVADDVTETRAPHP